jgi:hypothetical protein
VSALTAEELGRLRVSLDLLPEFDPVGLHIWDEEYERHVLVTEAHETILDLHLRQEDAFRIQRREARLDLADASTRDRVARWLGGRHGLRGGCVAPSWVNRTHDFMLGGAVMFRRKRNGHVSIVVPELVATALPDLRDLPDGSRYVDALALALVAVHVGGAS